MRHDAQNLLAFVLLSCSGASAGVVTHGMKGRVVAPPRVDDAAPELAAEVMAGYKSPHLVSTVSRKTAPSEVDASTDARLGLAMAGCIAPHLIDSGVARPAVDEVSDEVAEVGGLSLAGCTPPHLGQTLAAEERHHMPSDAPSPVATFVANLKTPVVELVAGIRKAPGTLSSRHAARSFPAL